MAQQQQTVRITTTETTNSSALVINSGYLCKPEGLLKVAQFVNIRNFLLFEKSTNTAYVLDFRDHMRGNNCISLQRSPHLGER